MPKLPNKSPTVTLAVADFPRSVHTEVKVHAARRGLRLKEALAELVLAGLKSLYVYIKSEEHLWTVGFFDPDGKFQPESDHSSPEDAAKRVARLNGGQSSGQ